MPDLPDVEQKFIADTGAFTAGVERMIADLKQLVDSVRDAQNQISALQLAIDKMHGRDLTIAVKTINDSISTHTEAVKGVSDGLGALGSGWGPGLGQVTEQARGATQAMEGLDTELQKKPGDFDRASAAAGRTSIATRSLAASLLFGTGIAGAFAGRWGAILHWVVAAGAEFLAVTIPAAIALGTALLVAAQGAQMVQLHMQSLYTATEATANMFHTTIGSALGLKSSLQQAQDAANPMVYGILGSVINDLKNNFQDLAGQGLKVVAVMNEFAARITVDLAGGAGQQMHALLSGMVTDLVEIGQIFGNVGHALLNFASAMPGLAAVLLKIVDAISQFILWVSKLPTWLIKAAMAMEEFYRWGGLVAAIIARIGPLIEIMVTGGLALLPMLFGRLAAIMGSLVGLGARMISWVASFLTYLARFSVVAGEAATGAWGLSRGLLAISQDTALMGWIGLAVVAMAAMFYALSRLKTGTTEWIASMQNAVNTAPALKLPAVLLASMAETTTRLQNAQRELASTTHTLSNATDAYNAGVRTTVVQQGIAASNAQQYSAAYQQLASETRNFNQWTVQTAHSVGTSFVGALVLAQQAGVKFKGILSGNAQDMLIASTQVSNLIQGYKAMGQTSGAVGADMTALGIQAGLQTSKVQQLNQAWDQFMQTLVGGTGGISQFIQGVHQMTSGMTSASASLGGQFGSIRQSAQGATFSLQGFSQKTAQSWQQFNAVVGQTAPQLIDWLRTAGAEGVLTGHNFTRAIADMVNSLIPLAGHSKAAQAELIGLWNESGHSASSFKQLVAQVDATNPSMHNLGKIVGDTTIAMSNMGKVAQNLGTVIQNDITNTMAQAALSSSRLGPLMLAYDQSLQKSATSAQTLNLRQQVMNVLMNTFHMTAAQANAALNVNTNSLRAGAAAEQHAADVQRLHNQIMRDATSIINGGRGARQNLITDLVNIGAKSDISKGKVATMISEITHIPKQEIMNLIMHGSASGHVSITESIFGRNSSSTPRLAQKPKHKAHGGHITGPGSGTSDSIPAYLSAGEYVVNAKAVNKYGTAMMDHINAQRFATGGQPTIQGISPPGLGQWAKTFHDNFKSEFANEFRAELQAGLNSGLAQGLAMGMAQARSNLMSQALSMAGAAGGGGSVAIGRRMAAAQGWTGAQWNALFNLWQRESGWNANAVNPSSGAAGIAQSLGHGAVPLGNAAAQIAWGLSYIRGRYGSPEAAWAHELCVPLDSEILTRRGWVTYDQLQPGDETIGFSPETGRNEWTPVLGISVYDDAPLVHLTSKTWDAICTLHHRWSAVHWKHVGRKGHKGRTKNEFRREDVLVEAQGITTRHSLRLAAEASTGDGPAISLQEAELLGWVLGDGSVAHLRSKPGSNPEHWRTGTGALVSVRLYQSKPRHVKHIDALVDGLLFNRSVRQTRKPNGELGLPLVTWEFYRSYSAELLKRSGYDHRNPVPFVISLSPDQRQAFMAGVFGAEGSHGGSGEFKGVSGYPLMKNYFQNDGAQQDAIILGIYLEGHRPGISEIDNRGTRIGRWTASTIGARIRETRPRIGGEKIQCEDAGHASVWCPTTGLGTWTMRQGRQVMLTGNSFGWYDKGGMLPPGLSVAYNGTGGPERVTPGGHMMTEGSIHSHPIIINLDGKTIWHNMQERTLRYNTRNSGARTGAVIPGDRPQT
jgi:hypothetical protein